jgi:hypothetical protein
VRSEGPPGVHVNFRGDCEEHVASWIRWSPLLHHPQSLFDIVQERQDWEEIRQPIVLDGNAVVDWDGKENKSEQIELALSTFSHSLTPLHLPHFYTLGKDYHSAIIRRWQLNCESWEIRTASG